ncbi:MAG TPA: response regulator, partial [Vicinamibacterales bacterium]|nr:response regulator [Vicinamibacterales bacterium]
MAKILVVDDDPDITFALSLFLKREQHEVRTAANRDEGMAALEAFSPDLMVLDVMMEQPDDGIAMAQDL